MLSTNKRNLWAESDDKKLRELLEKGKSYAQIGVALNRKETAVQQRASKLNVAIGKANKTWSHEDKKTLITMLQAGKQIPDIAVVINRNELAIYSFLSKHNVPTRKIQSFDYKTLLSKKEQHAKDAPKHKCLRCRKWFIHDGKGNWICPPCTNNKSEESRGLPEYYVGRAI